MTTGNILQGLLADSLASNTALLNFTGTALDTATNITLYEISTTAANAVDVTAVKIERGANDARIVFNETTDTWMLDQGAGAGLTAIATGTFTGNTLDQSYDQGGAGAGRTITVDSGAIVMTGSNAADETLEISNSAAGGGLLLTNGGAGKGIFIDQNGQGIALDIDSESTGVNVVDIQPTVLTTGTALDIGDADALTTGKIANLVSNSATTDTRSLIQITNDNTAATGATPLSVKQDAAQRAVFVDQTANANVLDLDTAATTADMIDLNGSTLTSGNLIQASVADSLTTGTALINVTGTALDTATAVTLTEISTTPANSVDVTAVKIERGANDARIVFNETTDTWMLDQGAGAGLTAITTGGMGANTALSNLAAVAINTTLVSDTDSTDDLGTASIAWANLYVDTIRTSTGSNLTINTDGGTIDIDDPTIDLSTQAVAVTLANTTNALNFDSNSLVIDATNNRVGVGTATPNTTFEANGTVSYTPSATTNITAAGGITVTKGIMRIQGNGGAIDITADPQVVAGQDGQLVVLQGDSNTNTVKLDNGTGLQLAGGVSFTLGKGDIIEFTYDSGDTLWYEIRRSDN